MFWLLVWIWDWIRCYFLGLIVVVNVIGILYVLEISEKQQLICNVFVHGFDHDFQLVNYFGTGFEELGI